MTCPPGFEALIARAESLAKHLTQASQPMKVRLAGIVLATAAVALENRSLGGLLALVRDIPVSHSVHHRPPRAAEEAIGEFQEMELESLRLFDAGNSFAEDFADLLSALEEVLRAGKRSALEKLSELCIMERAFA